MASFQPNILKGDFYGRLNFEEFLWENKPYAPVTLDPVLFHTILCRFFKVSNCDKLCLEFSLVFERINYRKCNTATSFNYNSRSRDNLLQAAYGNEFFVV